jgi:molybdenum cofactor cytidylyltransferase
MPLKDRIAVVSSDAVAGLLLPAGYRIVRNDAPEAGREASLRIGLGAALTSHAGTVLVCLGDMPNVTSAHLAALISAAASGQAAVSRAQGAEHFTPPLILPRRLVETILASPGTPARAVISSWSDVVTVEAPPLTLIDVDTQEDLAAAL